ncbi:hypothetical protein [Aliarcobacter skirrowii]|uniref:hypothetical protein n=1 Tax=Aliarcobacter skirrowii TaxID=28200 RepID=UPI0029A7EC5F|nr:hypothetical protein [Aliarcobacter skirrowii]MDX4036094.1 hypothetical protein [Aliarcobacter skirrowii]
MIKKAMDYAKNPVDEKVGISFQAPVSLKKEFERVCKEQNVSMTNLFLGLMKATIQEYPEYSTFSSGELLDIYFAKKYEYTSSLDLANKLSEYEIALNEAKYNNFFEDIEKLNKELIEIETILDERNVTYSKYDKGEK